MKNALVLLGSILLLFSCEKEGELTKSVVKTIGTEAVLTTTGSFVATPGETASGTVKIFLDGDQTKLQLQDFTVSSGPDLKVYLSQDTSPSNFVNLGNFLGNGSTVYNIPSKIDASSYKYVLIHCQQYNHTFAYALLTSK